MKQMAEKTIVIKNKDEEISKAVELVREYLRHENFSEDCGCSLAVAFDEMLSNVIHHGYNDLSEHSIKIILSVKGKDFIGIIEDDGVEFNPLLQPEANTSLPLSERKMGGLGIHLVRKMMDKVEYKRIKNKNVLTIFKADERK